MNSRYVRLFLAMSLDDAKEKLGLPRGSKPTEDEVNRAYRTKIIQNKGLHPDIGGGDDTEIVELNVAKDTLLGKYEEDGGYDRGPGATPPGGVVYTKPPPEIITFDEAKTKAGIPPGVTWMFVTDSVSSGYSSDEFLRRTTGYVFYGQTDQKHVFVSAENFQKDTYFIGGEGAVDTWTLREFSYPKKEGETLQPAWLYGNVVKAFKMFKLLEKKFNSKVQALPDGWHLQERIPHGKTVSIKHWLVNQGLVSGDDPSVVNRKNVVEITFRNRGLGEDEKAWFILTINGKEYELSPSDSKKFLTPSKHRGVATAIFGTYFYDESRKVLTRLPTAKKQKLFEWMSKNLTDLPAAAKAVFDAESVPPS